jgi:signal transduction histidine kinase
LAAIVTNAGAGLRWLAASNLEEARASFKRVVDDGIRAGKIVDSIRAMFKKEQTDRARLDLNDLIGHVLALLSGELQAQRIVLQKDLAPQLPLVQGHRGELQQVIFNLVRNAADAMSKNSDPTRVLMVMSEPQPPNGVLISIKDNGTGIDPKDIDHIFEPFFTTKSNGMGMGLSICRSIVEAHSGRLWASHRSHGGAVFHISLPTGEVTHETGLQRPSCTPAGSEDGKPDGPRV